MNPRRLYRSVNDRWIAGVAAGVAEYFDVDPILVRVIWLISIPLTGFISLLAYVIMIVAVPLGPEEWSQPSPWQPGGAPIGYGPGYAAPTAPAADPGATTAGAPGAPGAATDAGTPGAAPEAGAPGAPGAWGAPQGAAMPGQTPGWDWRWQTRQDRWQRRAERPWPSSPTPIVRAAGTGRRRRRASRAWPKSSGSRYCNPSASRTRRRSPHSLSSSPTSSWSAPTARS